MGRGGQVGRGEGGQSGGPELWLWLLLQSMAGGRQAAGGHPPYAATNCAAAGRQASAGEHTTHTPHPCS